MIKKAPDIVTSFNRYMVECESAGIEKGNSNRSVLIDTWWNVNKYTPDDLVYTGDVLIDTWWNVNIFVF